MFVSLLGGEVFVGSGGFLVRGGEADELRFRCCHCTGGHAASVC